MSPLIALLGPVLLLDEIKDKLENKEERDLVEQLQGKILRRVANEFDCDIAKDEHGMFKIVVDEFYNSRRRDKTCNGKIPAIKKHREITGWGLKESKEAVESWLLKTGRAHVTEGGYVEVPLPY